MEPVEPEMEEDDAPLLVAELLSDDELVGLLAAIGVEVTREKLDEWTARVPSAGEIAESLLEGRDASAVERQQASMCVRALWERWFPERTSLEMLDDRIDAGYQLDQADAAVGWLEVFEHLARWMDGEGLKSLSELEDRFEWSYFFSNWVQDVELSLLGACAKRPELFPRAIAFCEDTLLRFGADDEMTRDNFRRTMAELIFESGDADKAEALYTEWLAADPQWGWGWIGRSDLYRFTRTERRDSRRCEGILREALGVPGVRDREEITARLRECLLDRGRMGEAKELEADRQPRNTAPRYIPEVQVPLRAAKVGRNDPCPCGSGKKYKKCCLGKCVGEVGGLHQ